MCIRDRYDYVKVYVHSGLNEAGTDAHNGFSLPSGLFQRFFVNTVRDDFFPVGRAHIGAEVENVRLCIQGPAGAGQLGGQFFVVYDDEDVYKRQQVGHEQAHSHECVD